MVTNPKKKAYIGDAVQSFINQSYSNKELIIIHCNDYYFDEYLKNVYGILKDVRIIKRNPESLGAMRNAAVVSARGELIATWDDDDISHPRRLESQIREMVYRGKKFSYLIKYIHLFEDDHSLFLVNKVKIDMYVDSVAENTFIGYKNAMPGKYLDLNSGEDTPINVEIVTKMNPYLHNDQHYLFVYRYCKNNTWGKQHHLDMCTHSHVDFNRWDIEKVFEEYHKVIPTGTWIMKDNRLNVHTRITVNPQGITFHV